MLPPQKISERLRETQKFYEPKPPTLLIRLWHVINGSALAAVMILFASLSRLVASFTSADRNTESDPLSSCFISGFFFVSFPTYHLSTARKDYVRVSESLIIAAEALEKEARPEHMLKMMKVTRLSRKLIAAYLGEAVSAVTMIIAMWIHSNASPMPFLGKESVYYQLVCCAELVVVIPMGMFAVVSFAMFHLEVTLCMTCMYDILGKLLRMVSTRERVHELIRIHQLLLNASKIFRDVFSAQWFGLLFNLITIMIIATFTVIALSFEVNLSLLTVICLSFLFGACISGEMITVSSESIGFAVYQNDWINTMSELRGDMSLVIMRSQKTVGITAGVLGNLNLVQLGSVLKNWYRYVQALLKLRRNLSFR